MTPFHSNFVRLVFEKTSLTCIDNYSFTTLGKTCLSKIIGFSRSHLVQCDFKKLQCFFSLDDLVLKTNDGASYFEVHETMKRLFFALWFSLFLNCYDFYPFFFKMATLHQVGGTQLETTQGLCNYIHVLKPEKTADILRRHHWSPREMTSEKRAQKFHTDDASLSRSGQCF